MKRNKPSGFTLVELMIVVAIIAIIAVVVIQVTSPPKLERVLAATPKGNCYIKLDEETHIHELTGFLQKHPEFEVTSDEGGKTILLKRTSCNK